MVGPQVPFSEEIQKLKHRLKGETFRDAMGRQAEATSDSSEHHTKLYDALINQRVVFAGRIQAAVGSPKRVTPFNCLAGDTMLVTKEYGVVRIDSLSGETVNVLDAGGEWCPSPIIAHGRKPLMSVRLTNGNKSRTFNCTEDHRWITSDGEDVLSKDLHVGVKIPHVTHVVGGLDHPEYEDGLVHGAIYGDGTRNQGGFTIRVCSDHTEFNNIFSRYPSSNPPSSDGDPHYYVYGTQTDLKKLPDPSDVSTRYLLGFLRGWFLADGCVSNQPEVTLCGDAAEESWLRQWGPVVGWYVTGSSLLVKETNYGVRNKASRNIRFDLRSMSTDDVLITRKKERLISPSTCEWRVAELTPLTGEGHVYCPVVVSTKSFVLDGGVMTGNCFVGPTLHDSFTDGPTNPKDKSVSIMGSTKLGADTMRMGGGLGTDFSTLRPMGDLIRGVMSITGGPLQFMPIFNAVGDATASYGDRRGAQMGVLRVDHPDIEAFIRAKHDQKSLARFNLSIAVTDEFMHCVVDGLPFDLRFGGKVYSTVDARNLWEMVMRSTWDWAEPGVIFIDTVNRMNNLYYCETIAATNPCVPFETPILTDQGYTPIGDVIGQRVNVWNGFEFSEVTPRQTGENESMVNVELSDGSELTCTQGHKFILSNGSRIEARNLSVGDKLEKSEWPVIDGEDVHDIDYYAQGFFSGDGWVKKSSGAQYIGLYGAKIDIPHDWKECSRNTYDIVGGYEGTDTSLTKDYLFFEKDTFQSKDYVPHEASIESKRLWLAGLADADGTSTVDGSFQISSKCREFLAQVKKLINTMGANGSLQSMKDCWRISVSGNYVHDLKLSTYRLKQKTPERDSRRFLKVVSVELSGTEEKVYCFTENKNHSGVFNGVYTAQCGEQPLPPYGACLLGSLNLAKYVVGGKDDCRGLDLQQMEQDIYVFVRAMDNVIDKAIFPLPQQKREAESKRRMGIGVMGLANALEAVGYPYGGVGFIEQTDLLMGFIKNTCYLASIELAKEKGPFEMFDRDLFCAGQNFKTLSEEVQQGIFTHGIRNSHLVSMAPTGTIALGADNVSSGIEPVFAYEFNRPVNTPEGTINECVRDYGLETFGVRGRVADDVTPEQHVAVLTTVAKHVDSAVSKTCNVSGDTPWEDFKEIYMSAWRGGAKGCTTYNKNGKKAGLFTEKAKDPDPSGETCFIDPATGMKSCE